MRFLCARASGTGVLVVALLSASLPRVSPAADWPAWRGAEQGGVGVDVSLPLTWSSSENVRWRKELPGRGISCPVIVGGRIYVTCASLFRERRLHLLCLDVRSGEALWQRQLWATGSTQCHPKTSMAAPTPAADGTLVAALFASWDAVAYDPEGTLLWCRSLAQDYPVLSNQVGAASSPILHDGLFVCPLETDAEARIVALDARTGETRWSVLRPAGINWTTPLLLARALDVEPLIVVQSSRGLSALGLSSGAERWSHAAKLDSIASPIAGAGLIFAPGGQTVALRAPSPASPTSTSTAASTSTSTATATSAPDEDPVAPEVVWQSPKVRSSTASPIFYEGHLYAVNSAGVLACADPASGEVLWQERLDGPFSASPVAADGKLCLINEEGVATLVDTRAEPRVVGRCELGDRVLASPAIADGALFIRTERRLYRIEESS